MKRLILCILLVLVIIYLVPFVVYSLFTVLTDLKAPENTSPLQFLISILISKVGVAIAFVLIFYFALNAFRRQWFLYAFLWWLMSFIGEIGKPSGQTIH